jgi:DNA-binding MarR family transcriptional regulator
MVLLVGHLLELQLDDELQPYGLTTRQYIALQFVQQKPDCTRGDLAQALRISRQAAGGLSHRLMNSRMLERVDAPAGHSVSYFVTSFGRRILDQATAVVAELEQDLRQRLSSTTPGGLVGTMEDLLQQVNGQACDGKGYAAPSMEALRRPAGGSERLCQRRT